MSSPILLSQDEVQDVQVSREGRTPEATGESDEFTALGEGE